MKEKLTVLVLVLLAVISSACEQIHIKESSQSEIEVKNIQPAMPINIKGVFPNLTVMAPGLGSRSETGIGALIPWANKLWAVGYVAHIKGEGIGLYEISEDMTMRLHPVSVTGTFANRMVHWESGQVFYRPSCYCCRREC